MVCRIVVLLALLIAVPAAFGQNIPTTRSTAAAAVLRDVPYTFDSQKLSAAKNGFQFLRSFVAYFYLIAKQNEGSISILNPSLKGLLPTAVCMGDAHPENFGFLLQKTGVAFFTANDIDDSDVAPAALDLFRFMVSARLYDSTTALDPIVDAYIDGLNGKTRATPTVVDDMLVKSRSHSTEPSKSDVDHGRLIQPAEARALDPLELREVTAGVQKISGNWKIVDTYATKKVGGGSGGMLRYEVLLSGPKGKLLHVEFKEETAPSILPFVTSPASASARLLRALDATLDSSVDPIYQVVTIASREMLMRPRYSAIVGANLDKNTQAENRDLITYEAFTLGQLHARTISDAKEWTSVLTSTPRADWERDVTTMAAFIEKKYRSLP